MLHHNKTKKLGRKANPRRALIKGLSSDLLINGRIKTTEAKAKALRPGIEKIITLAKEDSVANRRLVMEKLTPQPSVLKKLFTEIGPRYKERPGGYTRIIKLPKRQGDASPMAFIELV